MFPVGLGEDRADDRRDHVLGAFRDNGEHIAHEMDPASLPRSALEDGANRFLQARVRVRHDQLHPVQSTDFQRAKKSRPEPFVFGVSDVETEDLSAPIGGDPDGDNNGLGDDAVIDSRFAVGRVEEHVWVVEGRQGPVTELRHLRIQPSADPRDFGL